MSVWSFQLLQNYQKTLHSPSTTSLNEQIKYFQNFMIHLFDSHIYIAAISEKNGTFLSLRTLRHSKLPIKLNCSRIFQCFHNFLNQIVCVYVTREFLSRADDCNQGDYQHLYNVVFCTYRHNL